MSELVITPPKRIAVMFQPGLWAPKKGGLYDLPLAVQKRLPSAWILIRPHNAEIRYELFDLVAHEPDFIIHVGHSLGAHQGLLNCYIGLGALGRDIDLAICLDLVPLGDYKGSLAQTDVPEELPESIKEVVEFRTFNRRGLFGIPYLTGMPWGRSILHPNVITRIHFHNKSTIRAEYLHNGDPVKVIDPRITHANIDESPIVQDFIWSQIERLSA